MASFTFARAAIKSSSAALANRSMFRSSLTCSRKGCRLEWSSRGMEPRSEASLSAEEDGSARSVLLSAILSSFWHNSRRTCFKTSPQFGTVSSRSRMEFSGVLAALGSEVFKQLNRESCSPSSAPTLAAYEAKVSTSMSLTFPACLRSRERGSKDTSSEPAIFQSKGVQRSFHVPRVRSKSCTCSGRGLCRTFS